MPSSKFAAITALLLFFLVIAFEISAVPDGVTIVHVSNSTKSPNSAEFLNTSGGTISIVNLNGTTQNSKWKAFAGNITGLFTLEDASGAAIYQWETAEVNGEVYATRSSGTINWSGIACASVNATEIENKLVNHTGNIDDNITATFDDTTHQSFLVGTVPIGSNDCLTLNTYVNGTSQDSDFEQMILYDRGSGYVDESHVFGNILYVSVIEDDVWGFNNQTYDFQMIVPDNGNDSTATPIPYYFYVELT